MELSACRTLSSTCQAVAPTMRDGDRTRVRQHVNFGVFGARAVGKGEVKMSPKQRPACLSRIEWSMKQSSAQESIKYSEEKDSLDQNTVPGRDRQAEVEQEEVAPCTC